MSAIHDYRLARKNVIEAIAALSDSAGRMSIEPMAARKGLDEMAIFLIAAHGLVAQLSAARLAVRVRRLPARIPRSATGPGPPCWPFRRGRAPPAPRPGRSPRRRSR